MRVWHLLQPGVLAFALKNAWHGFVDIDYTRIPNAVEIATYCPGE